jgi:hypothetical protein
LSRSKPRNSSFSRSSSPKITLISAIERLSDCPVPVKTDVGQVDLVLRLSDGTSEKIRDSQTIFTIIITKNHSNFRHCLQICMNERCVVKSM